METKAPANESSSSTVTETIAGHHRYTVKGYSFLKGLGPGKHISSDVFTIGGYDWAICFYPDGHKPQDKTTYVSLFVVLMSEAGYVRARYDIILLDRSGNRKHKLYRGNSAPHTYDARGILFGYEQFFKRADLDSSPYLKDVCLEFYCTLSVVMGTKNKRPNGFCINVPPTNLGISYKGFLDSGIATDIEFQVGEETFRAHKQILAARSEVFRAQFFGPIGNPNLDRVDVEEIAPPVFDAMLNFIYSDSLPDFDEDGGETSYCSSAVFAQHMLAAADRYGLDRLKLLCEEILVKEMTADSVAITLALAEQHNCLQLKSVSLQFAALTKNIGEVIQSEGYLHLKKSFPAVIAELLQIIVCNGGLLPENLV